MRVVGTVPVVVLLASLLAVEPVEVPRRGMLRMWEETRRDRRDVRHAREREAARIAVLRLPTHTADEHRQNADDKRARKNARRRELAARG